ncbi:Uncharacterized protein HZ326_23753 [Fusarium oxysporum f. sp. albedinis]|nr:Uncharacterized protein HZ326_23753 [Fusarium oxysporum f. sp. albedinis]
MIHDFPLICFTTSQKHSQKGAGPSRSIDTTAFRALSCVHYQKGATGLQPLILGPLLFVCFAWGEWLRT